MGKKSKSKAKSKTWGKPIIQNGGEQTQMTKNKKPVIDLHKIAGEMPNGHGFQQGVAGKPIHPVDAKTRAKKVVGI